MKLGENRTPDLIEVIRAAMTELSSEIFVALPGKVEKYDSTKQKADVKPLLKRGFTYDDGTDDVDVLPVIPEVPVVFPRGGGYFLSLPIKKGDSVLLVFSDRSLDLFLQSSGKVDLDPVDLRQHDITDAVAIPGLYPFPRAIVDDISNDLAMGKEQGAQVRVKTSTVEATSGGSPSAADFVAMAQKVDDFISKLDAVFRTDWTVVAQDGGAALKAAYLAKFFLPPGSTASTNLKAD